MDRLKELLGPGYRVEKLGEGWRVYEDKWEFVRCKSTLNKYYTGGKIYPVKAVKKDKVYTTFNDWGHTFDCLFKVCTEHATEAEYVAQLEAKAKELYGEVKVGDVFDRSHMGFTRDGLISVCEHNKGWEYSKIYDSFSFGGILMYEKGKWAKKMQVCTYAFLDNETLRISVPGLNLTKYDWLISKWVLELRDRINEEGYKPGHREGYGDHMMDAFRFSVANLIKEQKGGVVEPDPWEGIRFARCKVNSSASFTKGKVYEIQGDIDDTGCFIDDKGDRNGWIYNRISFDPVAVEIEEADGFYTIRGNGKKFRGTWDDFRKNMDKFFSL